MDLESNWAVNAGESGLFARFAFDVIAWKYGFSRLFIVHEDIMAMESTKFLFSRITLAVSSNAAASMGADYMSQLTQKEKGLGG